MKSGIKDYLVDRDLAGTNKEQTNQSPQSRCLSPLHVRDSGPVTPLDPALNHDAVMAEISRLRDA